MTALAIDGRVALVTGAARGIGFETARQLHAKGAKVVVVDLDQAACDDAAALISDTDAIGMSADVTDLGAMRGIVADTVERFGGLDIVVANAGIAPEPKPFIAMSDEEFDRVLNVDLNGVINTVRPAVKPIVERRGHITVIGSVYSFINGAGVAPYAIAKAGVEAFGRTLRVELAPHGASAGVGYFGFVDTEMVREGAKAPFSQKLEETIPSFYRKRITPAKAGAALVKGIENRSARVIEPAKWRPLSTLRGILNPIVDSAARDRPLLHEAILEAEERART